LEPLAEAFAQVLVSSPNLLVVVPLLLVEQLVKLAIVAVKQDAEGGSF
jgi:hypothetical protein